MKAQYKSKLILASASFLLLFPACENAREDMNKWAKQNSIKKHAPQGIPLTKKRQPIKANYSSCPKGTEVVDHDKELQPLTCRSATGVVFSATNAFQERYQNGNPKTQLVYNGESLLRLHWFQNGNPKEEVVYYGNEKNGPYRSWYENGTKKEVGHYTEGKKNGEFRYWDRNGKLIESGRYRKDKKYGVWNSNKRFPVRETFAADVLHGNAEYLSPNGTLSSHGSYRNGKKSGKWIYYHPNGKWSTAGNYDSQGNKTGTWKSYAQNGKLERKEYFKNGQISNQPALASNVEFSGGDTLGARPPSARDWEKRNSPRPKPSKVRPSKRWAPL
jgi:antitoxin component YwqK of YwqJK toxin-antitoxin module